MAQITLCDTCDRCYAKPDPQGCGSNTIELSEQLYLEGVERSRARREKLQTPMEYAIFAGTNKNYKAFAFAVANKITVNQALIAAKVQKDKMIYPDRPSKFSAEQIAKWERDFKSLGKWELVARKNGMSKDAIYYQCRVRPKLQGR
jgi:hypothetical protein